MEARLLAADTRHGADELVGSASQLLQHLRAELMGGGARGHLDGLEIEPAALAQAGENDIQQSGYFARDFFADRLRSFPVA
jgi:hypothetical protein